MNTKLKFMSSDEGKQFAAGPGGEIMVKYPLQYCKAAFIGERPKRDGVSLIRNGTATFLSLENHTYAVTCAHVIDGYQEVRAKAGAALFQIGMVEIRVDDQLVCKNDNVDLATIKLTDAQVAGLAKEGEIGSRVVLPAKWPPDPIKIGEPIMFGGFPGSWRERLAYDDLLFHSFSSVGVKISSSYADRFTCQLEREYWVTSIAQTSGARSMLLRELGGLSGGPVFVDRGLHFEFAGIIYQHSEAFDILFLRPAGLIQPDGSITNEL